MHVKTRNCRIPPRDNAGRSHGSSGFILAGLHNPELDQLNSEQLTELGFSIEDQSKQQTSGDFNSVSWRFTWEK
ncbi:MAG: hypothetical protein CM1200mP28_05190 [Deltaproteobacteria bacterium]|nr:MAG: hypothetical protein CM1200mP28_05190 [Deltaproteobacteria bacterium]